MAKQAADKSNPHYLILGEVLRPHGVRGELRLRLLTDYPERISNLEVIYVGSDPHQTKADIYHVEHMRMHKDYGLLKLKEIKDRNQADLLRDLYVMIDLDNAVPLEDDEVYLYQLIGLTVKTPDGKLLGELAEVLETGANDVYIVRGAPYGELLIPVTDETLQVIDLDEGVVLISPPDGLLPDTP